MVETHIGKRTFIGYKPEASYGVGAGAPYNVWLGGKVQNFTPTEDANWLDVNVVDGQDERNRSQAHTMHTQYSGSLLMYLQDGRMFKYAWGSVSNGGGPAFVNAIGEANVIPSFSLHTGNLHSVNPKSILYLGCMVNKLEVSWSAGNPVEVSMDILAQDSDGTLAVPPIASVTTAPYMSYNAKLEMDLASGTLAAPTTYGTITEGKFSISNEAVHPEYTNDTLGRKKGEPIPTKRIYEAEFTLHQVSQSIWNAWKTQLAIDGYVSARVTFTRGVDTAVFLLTNGTLKSAPSNTDVSEDVTTVTLAITFESYFAGYSQTQLIIP